MLSTHSFRSLLLVFALLLGVHGIAQNFSGFSYQAVVRDNVGDPVPSQTVGVQVTIQVGPTDTYVETHSATTDAYGLIALTIGQGTPVGGSAIATFADVEWASGLPITYSVAVDVTGGTNYTFLSGGPFKAVPFAMHALTSDSSTTSVPQTLTLSNDTLYITGGNSVDLSGLAGTPGWVLSGDTLHTDGRRVGIGTTNPTAKLEVNASGTGFRQTDGIVNVDLSVVGSSAYFGTSSPNHDLHFTAGGLDDMIIRGDNHRVGLGRNPTDQKLEVEGGAYFNGNVGIGTTTPAAKLHVEGTMRIADGTQGATKLLTSDAAGNASWQNLSAESIFGSGNLPVSDLSCLEDLATIATGTKPRYVMVNGDHAYVLNQNGLSMQVFNISDPSAPLVVSTVTGVTGFPISMAISGNYAYVLSSSYGSVRIYDISTPSAPVLAGSFFVEFFPRSVTISGNIMYVSRTSPDQISAYDISDPLSPVSLSFITTGAEPMSLQVAGDHLYAVNRQGNSMQVFNISNPAALSLSATIATGTTPQSVAVAGSHAYVVCSGTDNMQVFNISNPSAPSLVTTVATGDAPYGVTVAGTIAMVVNFGSNSMQVFNISDAAAPSLSNTIATGTNPHHVTVAGNHAYVVNHDSNSMQVFSLACPSMITLDPNTGAIGSMPLTGTVGAQGPAGPTGAQGATGATGPQGVSVTNAAITSDSLYVTLSDASVINAGKAVGPQGPTGPQGPAGPAVNANGTLNHLAKFSDTGTLLGDAAIVENAAGNVGIGTTAPASKLDVEGGIAVGAGYSGSTAAPANGAIIEGNVGIGTNTPNAALQFSNATAERKIVLAESVNNDHQVVGFGFAPGLLKYKVANTGASHVFYAGASATASNELMRIQGNGAVGIGTSSPNYRLEVSNVTGGTDMAIGSEDAAATDQTLYFRSGYPGLANANDITGYVRSAPANTGGRLILGTTDLSGAALTRLYINENGDIGIGTDPTGGARLQVVQSDDNVFVASFRNMLNTSGGRGVSIYSGQNTFSAASAVIGFYRPDGTNIGGVSQASSTSVTYATTSDIRLKTNIRDTRLGLRTVLDIEVKDYTYKDDPANQQTGFIAQQLHDHFPQAVIVGGDDVKTAPWMVDYGLMTPLLVKAVQEQQALIEELQASNAAKDEALNAMRSQLDANTALMQQLQSVLEAQTRK